MNFYQGFIVLRSRFFYLLEMKNLWWSVFCVYHCFHLDIHPLCLRINSYCDNHFSSGVSFAIVHESFRNLI